MQQPTLELLSATVNIRALEASELPRWPASLLRGTVGRSLRGMVCVLRSRKTCHDCPLVHNCVYPFLYEHAEHYTESSAGHAPAQPYILATGLKQQTRITEGDIISFSLTLLGKSHTFFPHLVCAIRDATRNGIGRNRETVGRFTVESLMVQGNNIYNADEQSLQIVPSPELITLPLLPEANDSPFEEYLIELETPLRVKNENRLQGHLTEEQLFRIVFRRIATVWGQFGTTAPHFAWNDLLNLMSHVDLHPLEEQWLELDRFSSRQGNAMKFGGIRGKYLLRGKVRPLLPYLRIAERIHIGKQTTFGLGKIRLTTSKSQIVATEKEYYYEGSP